MFCRSACALCCAMMTSLLLVPVSSAQVRHLSWELSESRPLATRPAYPYGVVDSTARPGFGPRVWMPAGHIGGQPRYPVAWGSPGPGYYGADQFSDPTVYARRGTGTLGVSPWVEIPLDGWRDVEDARNLWLKEQGLVGGVRSFRNPAVVRSGGSRASGLPVPRATIRVPEGTPRYRPQMQVRMSLPPGAPAALAERVQLRNGASAVASR